MLKAVLFDLDGTLLDTRDMILTSFKYAYCTVIGKDTLPPDEELLHLVGIPLYDQMEHFAPDRADELCAAYRENNARIHDTMTYGFEGTASMLAKLKDAGLRMAVITSKLRDPAMQGLEKEHLSEYFEFVIGADSHPKHKPDPGPLLAAAERMGLEPQDCFYVGDSPFDMQAAQGAGMYAIGVLWGMFTERELQDAGAQIIVSAVQELPEIILSSSI